MTAKRSVHTMKVQESVLEISVQAGAEAGYVPNLIRTIFPANQEAFG